MKTGSKIEGLNENINLDNNSINRISTGINRLDELLNGGLPSNSITLVSGSPGSGKTILCYHYLWEGLNSGEKCLFITIFLSITEAWRTGGRGHPNRSFLLLFVSLIEK